MHLVSGPVAIPDPPGVSTTHVERAEEMRDAAVSLLPADIAVMVAAVADWRVSEAGAMKIKKSEGEAAPALDLVENPDILKSIGHHAERPALVVGFAAETENVVANARLKLDRKGADMIVANDVSSALGVMGGERNHVHLVTREGVEDWPEMSKEEVAARLAQAIAARFGSRELATASHCSGSPAQGENGLTDMPAPLTSTAEPDGISIQRAASSLNGSETRQWPPLASIGDA